MSGESLYRVKGSIFRAHLKVLERDQKLETIRARVSPATQRLLQSPPLASSWMESPPLDEIVEQIELLEGMDGIRRMAEETLRLEMSGLLTPMVRGVMRIIGTSPHSLFSRMNDLVRTVIQDVEYSWSKTGEKSGVQLVRYPTAKNVPMRTFIGGIAGQKNTLNLCNVEGTVDDPVRRSQNSAEFVIRWK